MPRAEHRRASFRLAPAPGRGHARRSRRPTQRRGNDLQRRLDEAQARYRALAQRLPLTTYVSALDVLGAFVYISPQVESLLGFTPEEWLSERGLWLKRMHPEDRGRILPLLGRAHKSGRRFVAEYRLMDRGGRARWIRDESEAIRDEAGRPSSIQGSWIEITRRKEMEEAAEKMGRELDSSKSELKQFISVASHELNAPLRRIVNLGEMLKLRCQNHLDAEAAGLLAQMMSSADTAQRLVGGLVKYGEADQRTRLSTVDLNLAMQHVQEELSQTISAAQAQIICETLPLVWAEPALIERVFYNLLDNAIKFRSREAPRIHVSAARSGTQWRISIRDNGIGVHQQQAERIFSIFDRVDPAKEHAGIGLGLAVCKKIVESFGGRIWVESDPGEGSTFHLTLGLPPEGGSA